mmetsp:Transcript_27295/g.33143  ORF Transcript_27295/g.33143 Transcript_27295/m.33143 type:complete len:867 (-) Transcript_27295:274-2874(-)|eukprot:CAMPEP_0197850068 /NCGR_PEP_ID=MMETSP1438-20131217/14122_1 /TAXON_ID=1461541 /ORGANISM="Pterosperma sp., Strain CCMP1384" /LENGTH=866 /DNA_ID=CAMNT_0043463025 /DNA_START=162 /DNA_END=2762 /DNA_ORIENTATION=-
MADENRKFFDMDKFDKINDGDSGAQMAQSHAEESDETPLVGGKESSTGFEGPPEEKVLIAGKEVNSRLRDTHFLLRKMDRALNLRVDQAANDLNRMARVIMVGFFFLMLFVIGTFLINVMASEYSKEASPNNSGVMVVGGSDTDKPRVVKMANSESNVTKGKWKTTTGTSVKASQNKFEAPESMISSMAKDEFFDSLKFYKTIMEDGVTINFRVLGWYRTYPQSEDGEKIETRVHLIVGNQAGRIVFEKESVFFNDVVLSLVYPNRQEVVEESTARHLLQKGRGMAMPGRGGSASRGGEQNPCMILGHPDCQIAEGQNIPHIFATPGMDRSEAANYLGQGQQWVDALQAREDRNRKIAERHNVEYVGAEEFMARAEEIQQIGGIHALGSWNMDALIADARAMKDPQEDTSGEGAYYCDEDRLNFSGEMVCFRQEDMMSGMQAHAHASLYDDTGMIPNFFVQDNFMMGTATELANPGELYYGSQWLHENPFGLWVPRLVNVDKGAPFQWNMDDDTEPFNCQWSPSETSPLAGKSYNPKFSKFSECGPEGTSRWGVLGYNNEGKAYKDRAAAKDSEAMSTFEYGPYADDDYYMFYTNVYYGDGIGDSGRNRDGSNWPEKEMGNLAPYNRERHWPCFRAGNTPRSNNGMISRGGQPTAFPGWYPVQYVGDGAPRLNIDDSYGMIGNSGGADSITYPYTGSMTRWNFNKYTGTHGDQFGCQAGSPETHIELYTVSFDLSSKYRSNQNEFMGFGRSAQWVLKGYIADKYRTGYMFFGNGEELYDYLRIMFYYGRFMESGWYRDQQRNSDFSNWDGTNAVTKAKFAPSPDKKDKWSGGKSAPSGGKGAPAPSGGKGGRLSPAQMALMMKRGK